VPLEDVAPCGAPRPKRERARAPLDFCPAACGAPHLGAPARRPTRGAGGMLARPRGRILREGVGHSLSTWPRARVCNSVTFARLTALMYVWADSQRACVHPESR